MSRVYITWPVTDRFIRWQRLRLLTCFAMEFDELIHWLNSITLYGRPRPHWPSYNQSFLYGGHPKSISRWIWYFLNPLFLSLSQTVTNLRPPKVCHKLLTLFRMQMRSLIYLLKIKWQHIDNNRLKSKPHYKKHGWSQDVEGYTKYYWYDALKINCCGN